MSAAVRHANCRAKARPWFTRSPRTLLCSPGPRVRLYCRALPGQHARGQNLLLSVSPCTRRACLPRDQCSTDLSFRSARDWSLGTDAARFRSAGGYFCLAFSSTFACVALDLQTLLSPIYSLSQFAPL